MKTHHEVIRHWSGWCCVWALILGLWACDSSTPPEISSQSVVAPHYTLRVGGEVRQEGAGFVVAWRDPAWPLVLTSHRVFTPDHGFAAFIPTRQLAAQIKTVMLYEAFSPRSVVSSAGPMIALKGVSIEEGGSDLAAMWGAPALTAHALPLSERKPEEGEALWIAARASAGRQTMHKVRVLAVGARSLSTSAPRDPSLPTGSPILDADGQVVGMLLGCKAERCQANGGWSMLAMLAASLPEDGRPTSLTQRELAGALNLQRARDDEQGRKGCKGPGTLLRWGADDNGDGELQIDETFSAGLLCEPDPERRWTLTFAPKDGEGSFRASTKVTKRLPGLTEKDKLKLHARTLSSAQPDGGFKVEQVMARVAMSRNGAKVSDDGLKAMEKLRVTFLYDKQGALKELTGFDKLLSALTRNPDIQTMVRTRMINRLERNHETRVKPLLGREVHLGEVWLGTELVTLPTGESLEILSATIIAAEVPCGAQRCLRLHYVQGSDREQLRERLGEFVSEVPPFPPLRPPRQKGLVVLAEGERLLEPATLMLYEESFVRTYRVPTDMRASTGRVDVFVTEDYRMRAAYDE